MIALVTGASGFIGSNLAAALIAGGHEVRSVGRSGGAPKLEGGVGVASHDQVDYGVAGLALAEGRARDLMSGVDVVFHVAGVTKAASRAGFRQGNVDATANLLRVIGSGSPTRLRFLLVSSQAAAGPAASVDRPVTEEAEPAPYEPYGRSKREAELVALRAADAVDVTVVRPSTVYGPGDQDFLAVFKSVARGVAIYPAIREHWVSVIEVSDVVRGIIAAATAPVAVGRTYFLANPEPVQFEMLYRLAAKAAGREEISAIDLPAAIVDAAGYVGTALHRITGTTGLVNHYKTALSKPAYWICSPARAARELGFEPRVSLTEGMDRTYGWYRAHRWL